MSRVPSRRAQWQLALILAVLPSWLAAQGASTPVWDPSSTLTGNHFPGSPNGGAGTGNVPLGPIPVTAAKLAPFSGASGNLINFGVGGSTRAKGGAGHAQGSNLAKITFPSGTGVDQTDPVGNIPHNNASIFQMDFNFRWDITAGTFGPPINGTFAIPVGAKVAAGGSASFEYEVHWDALVAGTPMPDIRSPFIGGLTFSSPGTYLTSVTSGAGVFSPSSIASGAETEIIVRGFLRFKADNDTAPVLIEILGPDVVNDSSSNFFAEFTNPSHPLFAQTQDLRYIPSAGFDEVIPEPSSAALLTIAAAGLLRRRRSA